MLKIIFLRHGESLANEKRIFAGESDFPLTLKGMEQAKRTSEYVIQHYHIDKIYSSDLKRAYDTAKAVADVLHLPIHKEKAFEEMHVGVWEGKLHTDLIQEYPNQYYIFKNDVSKFMPKAGETMEELYNRTTERLNEIIFKNDDSTILIATHGLALRSMMSYIMYSDFKRVQEVPIISNASVTEIDVDKGKKIFNIIKYGYDEHLEGMITKVHFAE